MVPGIVSVVFNSRYLPARWSEGGAGWWWRQDLQRLQSPSPGVVLGGPDVLGGQHPDRGQSEVFVLGFPRGRSGAQGLPLPADGTLVQLDHALAAKPVPPLGAATAKVLARAPRFEAHDARFPRSTWMGGLARGHPQESVNSEQGSSGPGGHVLLARVSQCVMWCNVCLRSGLHRVLRWRANLLAEPIGSV